MQIFSLVAGAFENTIGGVDAAVWILVNGAVVLLVWFVVHQVKKQKTQRDTFEAVVQDNEEIRNIKTPATDYKIEADWLLPFEPTTGYVRTRGWLRDPSGQYKSRYFNGSGWTSLVMTAEGEEISVPIRPIRESLESFETSMADDVAATSASIPDQAVHSPEPQRDGVILANAQTISQVSLVSENLNSIAMLYREGLLTEAEFNRAKEKILE